MKFQQRAHLWPAAKLIIVRIPSAGASSTRMAPDDNVSVWAATTSALETLKSSLRLRGVFTREANAASNQHDPHVCFKCFSDLLFLSSVFQSASELRLLL